MPHSTCEGRTTTAGQDDPEAGPARSTKRRALRAGVVSAVVVAVSAGSVATAGAAWNRSDTQKSLKTLPSYHPERAWLVKKTSGASTNEIFASAKRNTKNWQSGPMIMNGDGRLLWYKPLPSKLGSAFDVRAQTYEGKPVVTWWEGTLLRGYGEGQGQIYDQSYQPVATVKAGNGLKMDLHEFKITPEGTALLIAYKAERGDTTSRRGGSKNGLIHNNYVQEVDIKTGKVLMQWNAGKDIKLTESYNTIPRDRTIPFDYMHFNSVNVTADGNLVVSARATHAYYKIDRKTGKLIWRMGGRKSDFKMGKGSRTAFQHDVHQVSPTIWSAYDNNADAPAKGIESRGVYLKVDEKKRTVTLAREFEHPTPILAVSQGNMQTLPNGNVFVGWGGDRQNMTEFDAKGKLVADLKFLSSAVDTYRAYRFDWTGTPLAPPRLVAAKSGSKTKVNMSWNGATEVASWRVLAGPADDQLAAVATVPWRDLETGANVSTTQPRVQVQALDAAGTVLSTSAPVAVSGR